MADICPSCWREHTGKCDTRPLEERKLDADRKAAAKAAEAERARRKKDGKRR